MKKVIFSLLIVVLCSFSFQSDENENFVEEYASGSAGIAKEMWLNLPGIDKPQKLWVNIIDDNIILDGDIVLNKTSALNWIDQLETNGMWKNWSDNLPGINDVPIIGDFTGGIDNIEKNNSLPPSYNISFDLKEIVSNFNDLSNISNLNFPSSIDNMMNYDIGPDDMVNPAVATNQQSARWSNATIPYVIQRGFPSYKQQEIEAAIREINTETNITMVRRTNQRDYVSFFYGNGCWSNVGKVGGKQDISIANGCGKGSVVHEICHAAGLWHEQSRSDRDRFVTIFWSNIISSNKHNFDMQTSGAVDIGNYNFQSIMHYGGNAFSRNGKPTIVSRTGTSFGQRKGLSSGDITALNTLYPNGNGGGTIPKPSPKPPTTSNKEIYASTNRGDGKAYFFKDRNYTRYNTYIWRKDYGYPKSTTAQWRGINWSAPDAALSWGNGKVYLFKGTEYVRFDTSNGTMDYGYPKAITSNWPISWNYLDAAVNRGDGQKIYFFKGDKYVRVDLNTGDVDSGYPKKISDGWEGLYWNNIDAAVNWNSNKIYFFKGNQYMRYDMSRGKIDSGYPRSIAKYWPEI